MTQKISVLEIYLFSLYYIYVVRYFEEKKFILEILLRRIVFHIVTIRADRI